jgi:hypothetical protein
LLRLCTFDFIQYSFALSISSLFLFHSHIYFYLYILAYTYSFNLQSQKRIKKLFTVGFVGNFGSFFLFLFTSEVDSIEIFKFWTGLTRLEIIFLVLGPKKKKKKRNTRTRMNPSRSALPKAHRVDHSLCELRISIFKPVHCGAGCEKHVNPAQSDPRPPLYTAKMAFRTNLHTHKYGLES